MAVCDPSLTLADHLINFQFIKAFTCTYFTTAGMLVTGLFVYGAIGISIYIRTGSVVLPAILTLLVGGAVIGQVAAPATAVLTVLVLAVGGGALAFLYRAYSH